MSDSATDDELVARGRAGDESALVALYLRYRPRVYGYVLRMTGDRDLADEVFAATFARVLGRLTHYRPEGKFEAYLFRAARSCLAEEITDRGRGGRTDVPLDDLPVPSARSPDEAVSDAELAELARAAVARLPIHLREVVVLRLWEGLDHATIGDIVGVGEATVRSRLRYALQHLRRAMPDGVGGE